MRTLKNRRNRRGFTLIELLVVVLILAILMAVALPLYLSAVADSQLKTCRANMQTIANAVQAARVKANANNYSAFTGAVSTTLEPDLASVPICPSNPGTNTYTIIAAGASTSDGKTVPANGFAVQCSTATHGSFVPGVDAK